MSPSFLKSEAFDKKVYLILSNQRLSQNGRITKNADIRSGEKNHRAEAQVVHENLPRLRGTQRRNRAEMPKMQGQKPALEEARNSKVNSPLFYSA